jgi:hypothetical protein
MPYPEQGIRVTRLSDLDVRSVQLTTLKAELAESIEEFSDKHGNG